MQVPDTAIAITDVTVLATSLTEDGYDTIARTGTGLDQNLEVYIPGADTSVTSSGSSPEHKGYVRQISKVDEAKCGTDPNAVGLSSPGLLVLAVPHKWAINAKCLIVRRDAPHHTAGGFGGESRRRMPLP